MRRADFTLSGTHLHEPGEPPLLLRDASWSSSFGGRERSPSQMATSRISSPLSAGHLRSHVGTRELPSKLTQFILRQFTNFFAAK
jgi:hypothetical protein